MIDPFILEWIEHRTSITRLSGFRKGLEETGVRFRDDLVPLADTSLENAYEQVAAFLKRGLEFTAVFASSDTTALGAWKALREHGRRIPDDVSLIGYDDIPFADFISLTTIAQPAYEAGRNAVMLLLDLIAGRRHPPQRIMLRESLIIRKTCRRL